MNAKESHPETGKPSFKTGETTRPVRSACCDPDEYVRQPAKPRSPIIDGLETVRSQPRPLFNAEFIRLVKLWRLIASKYNPEQIPGHDLEFLRWLLQGRAREAVIFLRRQPDINVWHALKAIERIANFNIPESSALQNQIAMANLVWLKRELTGDLSKDSRVDIRKIRLDPQRRLRSKH